MTYDNIKSHKKQAFPSLYKIHFWKNYWMARDQILHNPPPTHPLTYLSVNKAYCALKPFLYPDKNGLRNFPIQSEIRFCVIRSSILEPLGRTLTGLQFSTKVLSLLLKIGDTSANLRSSGKFLLSRTSSF